ncbi:MAG: hypothetical protein ABEJ46_03530 [Gemmatimonadota bacterium]
MNRIVQETAPSTDRVIRWHRFETRFGETGVAATDRGLAARAIVKLSTCPWIWPG